MNENVKYLKKIGDPDGRYHIYTPALAARGDMVAFDPKVKPLPAAKEKEGDYSMKSKGFGAYDIMKGSEIVESVTKDEGGKERAKARVDELNATPGE